MNARRRRRGLTPGILALGLAVSGCLAQQAAFVPEAAPAFVDPLGGFGTEIRLGRTFADAGHSRVLVYSKGARHAVNPAGRRVTVVLATVIVTNEGDKPFAFNPDDVRLEVNSRFSYEPTDVEWTDPPPVRGWIRGLEHARDSRTSVPPKSLTSYSLLFEIGPPQAFYQLRRYRLKFTVSRGEKNKRVRIAFIPYERSGYAVTSGGRSYYRSGPFGSSYGTRGYIGGPGWGLEYRSSGESYQGF